ncbi:MAG TPA: prepilin-type N-terminal cleavage/methylation domain-containing protein [Kofleriaceae bacterium]|nr:prepilin-type N-terminal cleavage/methylation domain-containing protein [Kofleriaceae bacterium]
MAPDRVTRRSEQSGFTLIEVMVAMLLTALTVIGVLGLYRVESRASSFSRRETEAAVLAQDKLEELRTQAAPTAASGPTQDPAIVDQLTGATIFTRTYTIATTSDPLVFKIIVTVQWDEDGVPRTVTVTGQRGST